MHSRARSPPDSTEIGFSTASRAEQERPGDVEDFLVLLAEGAALDRR